MRKGRSHPLLRGGHVQPCSTPPRRLLANTRRFCGRNCLMRCTATLPIGTKKRKLTEQYCSRYGGSLRLILPAMSSGISLSSAQPTLSRPFRICSAEIYWLALLPITRLDTTAPLPERAAIEPPFPASICAVGQLIPEAILRACAVIMLPASSRRTLVRRSGGTRPTLSRLCLRSDSVTCAFEGS